ncbi:hypothetical protein NDN08_003301 [Rhodosorus marinus]|uniref:Elongator complex protein 1 n=1 Tax=Rhodosorus marinus TaxID=101924 RepID=A0AAV8UW44_9RHOD|nr:hypothetical protein NDN08_003301 [Rhodosorus marinus]
MRNLKLLGVDVEEHRHLDSSEIVEWFHHVEEETWICTVLRSGEICEEDEAVGWISGGVTASKVSYDGELLAICSGDQSLVLMRTSSWDLVTEVNLAANARGCAWRRDDAFLAVFLENGHVFVFNPDGVQEAVSEKALTEVVGCCSFSRPGGLIAAGIPSSGQVRFYERNCLRHLRSDFQSSAKQMSDLSFNATGSLLALLDEEPKRLLIYFFSNYRWYLKQDIGLPDTVQSLIWDAENALKIRAYTNVGESISFEFSWSTIVSSDETNTAAVVDGQSILLTHLRNQIIPPPMCSEDIVLERSISQVFFARGEGVLYALLSDGQLVDVQSKDQVASLSPGVFPRMPCISRAASRLVIVAGGKGADESLQVYETSPGAPAELIAEHPMDTGVADVVSSTSAKGFFFVATKGKRLFRVSPSGDMEAVPSSESADILSFATCEFQSSLSSSEYLLLLCGGGLLKVLDWQTGREGTISDECTSFDATSKFLVYSTRSNVIHTVYLEHQEHPKSFPSLEDILMSPGPKSEIVPGRPIDRGSKIVKALSDQMRVVLQAPRGNLECFVPRPMAVSQLQNKIRDRDYRGAFKLCREQRLDGDLIVAEDFDANKFVDEVGHPTRLSVFVSQLSLVALEKVGDALLAAMGRDNVKYVHTVVTTLMSFEPPRVGAALRAISQNTEGESEEAMMDYLLILSKNQEEVYAAALATYDLRLASLVVAHSQLDPKAHREELESLQALPELNRKFEIASRVGKFDEALQFLRVFETSDVVIKFACEHELYASAIPLFAGDSDSVKVVKEAYALSCMKKCLYAEAAGLYQSTGEFMKAAEAYLESGDYLMSMSSARLELSGEQLDSFLREVATRMESESKPRDAAYVLSECLAEREAAVDVLCSAGEWRHAFDISTRHKELGLIEGLVVPQMVLSHESRITELSELNIKLTERSRRLQVVRDLKSRRREREDDESSDVFPESDAGSMVSDFTFGSQTSQATDLTGPSLAIGSTSAKREKYAARKRAKAQKKRKRIVQGHPQEEEYLVEYLRNAIILEQSVADIVDLIMAFVFVGRMDEAGNLQRSLIEVLNTCGSFPEDVLEGKDHVHQRSWVLHMLIIEENSPQ